LSGRIGLIKVKSIPTLESETISSVITCLGVTDVRAFGLAWDDCEALLHQLGFSPCVEVVAV